MGMATVEDRGSMRTTPTDRLWEDMPVLLRGWPRGEALLLRAFSPRVQVGQSSRTRMRMRAFSNALPGSRAKAPNNSRSRTISNNSIHHRSDPLHLPPRSSICTSRTLLASIGSVVPPQTPLHELLAARHLHLKHLLTPRVDPLGWEISKRDTQHLEFQERTLSTRCKLRVRPRQHGGPSTGARRRCEGRHSLKLNHKHSRAADGVPQSDRRILPTDHQSLSKE